VIFWNVGVQYPESADNFATDIRQEWILDVASRAEGFENFARVIGNRCGIDPVRLEFSKRELQLDELVAAVGSPIGAAAEDQQQPICSHELGQCSAPAMLVGQGEIRNLRADFRTGLVTVVLGLHESSPVVGRNVLSAGREFADYVVKDCSLGLLFHCFLSSLHRRLFSLTPAYISKNIC
jgi:hypothetical protein